MQWSVCTPFITFPCLPSFSLFPFSFLYSLSFTLFPRFFPFLIEYSSHLFFALFTLLFSSLSSFLFYQGFLNSSTFLSLYSPLATLTPLHPLSDYVWWGVLAKVMFIFCLGLALVTTVFGASRGFFEENRKRIVKVFIVLRKPS